MTNGWYADIWCIWWHVCLFLWTQMSAFLSEGIHVFVRCVLAGWIWHARVYPMMFKFCFTVLIRPPSAFLGFFNCKHRPQWNHRWLQFEWHAAGSSSQISRCPDETWLGPNWGKNQQLQSRHRVYSRSLIVYCWKCFDVCNRCLLSSIIHSLKASFSQ